MLAPLLLAALAACKSEPDDDDSCTLRYELVGGEPSERYDRIFVDPNGAWVSRAIHSAGQSQPDEAIYLWFDGSGQTLVGSRGPWSRRRS